MSTQRQEMYFEPLPSYGGTKSPTSTPEATAEAWLDRFPEKRAENRPNGGIILSAPSVGKSEFRDLRGEELEAAKAKAKREHKAALKAQQEKDAQCAKDIAKQLIEWRKEQQEAKLKMSTETGQAVIDALKANKVYKIADFDKSRPTLQKIISEARGRGYQIKVIKKGRCAVGYQLTGIKKP